MLLWASVRGSRDSTSDGVRVVRAPAPFENGDVIVSIEDIPIASEAVLEGVNEHVHSGQTLRVEVQRAGQRRKLDVLVP